MYCFLPQEAADCGKGGEAKEVVEVVRLWW